MQIFGQLQVHFIQVFTDAANIQFCIATALYPEGTDEDLVEGGPAVTIGYDFVEE